MVCVAGTLEPRPIGRMKLQLEGLFRLKENPGPGMCVVFGCRKKHITTARCGQMFLCSCHYQRRWRAMSPKVAAYRALKDRAKRRKLEFTLTLECFIRITDAASYWTHQPETDGDVLTIDRVKAEFGYSDDNVEVITKSSNSAKGNRERHLSPVVQAILARKRAAAPVAVTWAAEDSWLDDGDPF